MLHDISRAFFSPLSLLAGKFFAKVDNITESNLNEYVALRKPFTL